MACRFAQRVNFCFINNCLPAAYYYAANIVLGSSVKKSHALFLEFFIGSHFFCSQAHKKITRRYKKPQVKKGFFPLRHAHVGAAYLSAKKVARKCNIFKNLELKINRGKPSIFQTLTLTTIFFKILHQLTPANRIIHKTKVKFFVRDKMLDL